MLLSSVVPMPGDAQITNKAGMLAGRKRSVSRVATKRLPMIA